MGYDEELCISHSKCHILLLFNSVILCLAFQGFFTLCRWILSVWISKITYRYWPSLSRRASGVSASLFCYQLSESTPRFYMAQLSSVLDTYLIAMIETPNIDIILKMYSHTLEKVLMKNDLTNSCLLYLLMSIVYFVLNEECTTWLGTVSKCSAYWTVESTWNFSQLLMFEIS